MSAVQSVSYVLSVVIIDVSSNYSSAEDMRGFTRRMFNVLKPSGASAICTSTPTPPRRPQPANPVRSRSPSPPPPPIVTPLLEMGFGLQHIKQALAATGEIHSCTDVLELELSSTSLAIIYCYFNV